MSDPKAEAEAPAAAAAATDAATNDAAAGNETAPTETPTSCCPPTRVPALTPKEEYKGEGTFETVKNEANDKELRVYKVGGTEGNKKAIVLVPDVFGLDSGRHFGVCDTLAKETGCMVVAPDLFRGDVATFEMLGTPSFGELCKRNPVEAQQKDLDCLYAKVLPADQFDSLAVIGFCWGSWVVFHECTRIADARIKCGLNFHPSLGLEGMYGREMAPLAEGVKLPQLVCPCKDDPAELKAGGILKPELCEIHGFEEENHGFMTQGDVSVDQVSKDIAKGMELAKTFLAGKL